MAYENSVKSDSLDQSVLLDRIVKEVLYKLGQIKKVILLEDVAYPEAWLKQVEETNLVVYVAAIDDINAEDQNACEFWLPELSIAQMMSVMQGNPNGRVSEVLFSALLYGKNVSVPREGVEVLNEGIVRTPFTEPFFEALEKLTQSGLGIQTLPENKGCNSVGNESLEVAVQSDRPTNSSQMQGCITFDKKALTEKHLKAFINEGINKVVLSKDSILTPSAKDFIRINPIKIDRK